MHRAPPLASSRSLNHKYHHQRSSSPIDPLINIELLPEPYQYSKPNKIYKVVGPIRTAVPLESLQVLQRCSPMARQLRYPQMRK